MEEGLFILMKCMHTTDPDMAIKPGSIMANVATLFLFNH